MAPGNSLPLYGNDKTMNLNSLVLANIQASPYFKHQLYELKTYHQVIDEIYYKVNHLEPWEKGSRKTAGQTGMCGGVRGVGTGGIVSSAYCLLYKLYTLKLTRKQVIGLCSHADSPFIRALGLMYIRYTQPPHTFWEWFEAYLDDEEEVDPKAGGGNNMTIGEMAEQLLVKLEWYGTLFPRIPVPIQKEIETKMRQHKDYRGQAHRHSRQIGDGDEDMSQTCQQNNRGGNDAFFGEAERMARLADREMAQRSVPQHKSPAREREVSDSNAHRRRSRSRDSRARRSRDRSHERRKESRRRSRSRSTAKKDKKSGRHRSRSRSRDRKEKKHHKHSRRSSSRGRHHDDEDKRIRDDQKYSSRDDDFQRDLKREMDRVKRSKNGVDCDK